TRPELGSLEQFWSAWQYFSSDRSPANQMENKTNCADVRMVVSLLKAGPPAPPIAAAAMPIHARRADLHTRDPGWCLRCHTNARWRPILQLPGAPVAFWRLKTIFDRS